MNFRKGTSRWSPVLVGAVAVGAALSSGACTFWAPHSLVVSDRPIREAVLVGKRVEGQVCNRYLLGLIPIDGNPPMELMMQQFHDAAPQAVAFQDLRFDMSWTYYFVYTESCLLGSAEPVVPVIKAPRRGPAPPPDEQPMPSRSSPPAAAPAPSDGASDKPKTPEEIEQEMLGGTK